MANQASSHASRPLPIMAAATPTQKPQIEPTSVEVNAPFSSNPSMAMLMMPERSQMMPAQAPKMSGVENVTPDASMPTNENSRPAAAHARNDMNIVIMASASTTLLHLPK